MSQEEYAVIGEMVVNLLLVAAPIFLGAFVLRWYSERLRSKKLGHKKPKR